MESVTLKFVEIKNFRSIVDSGRFFLPEDRIAVLVGQNESGKTSVVDALRAFGRRKLSAEDRNEIRESTSIVCTFRFSASHLDQIFSDYPDTRSRLSSLENGGALDVNVQVLFPVGKTAGIASVIEPQINQAVSQSDADSQVTGEIPLVEPKSGSNLLEFSEIERILIDSLPRISVFTDDSLLPREILLQEIEVEVSKAQGLKGARNFLKVLGVNLTRLKEDIASSTARRTLEEELNRDFTANFNEFWTQEVVEGNRATVHVGLENVRAGYPNAGADQLTFTVESRNKHLFPDQRSKGFQWFLSFYLQLMVLPKDQINILLLDEPGAHLHIKAKKNLLSVLEEVKDRAQIIYTTHEPELIEWDKLHRIRVISQLADKGTIVETVEKAASRSGSGDALTPIVRSMGADFSKLPLDKQGTAILEEPSAFYYLQAWKKLLGVKRHYALVPAMGANNVPQYVNLLIGWGFRYKAILDDDSQGRGVYRQIVQDWALDHDEQNERLFRLTNGPTIEELFSNIDFQKFVLERTNAQLVKGADVSKLVRNNTAGKALLAKKFFIQVENGKLSKDNFDAETKSNFEKVFNFLSY